MSSDLQRMALVAGGFVVLFVSGFWLARGERPYGVVLFAVHKLAAVAVLVYVAVVAYRAHTAGGLSAAAWTLVAAAVLGFLGLIGTGGAMSAMETTPAFVPLTHKIAPYVTTACTIAALYVIGRGSA